VKGLPPRSTIVGIRMISCMLIALPFLGLVFGAEYTNVEIAYGFFNKNGKAVHVDKLPVFAVNMISDPPQKFPHRGDILDAKQFDKIELVSELGRGAEGVVFLGVSRRSSLKYAIKFNIVPAANEEQMTIEKEFEILYRVGTQFPSYFPTVYFLSGEGWFWYDNRDTYVRYAIMEAFDSNLGAMRIGDKGLALPEVTVASVGIRLVESLEHLHSTGNIHGDIHFQNILVDKKGSRVVLGDFGFTAPFLNADGSHVSDNRIEVDFHGKNIKYLSPYQLDARPVTSRREDIFRLAETLVRCVNSSAFDKFVGLHSKGAESLRKVKLAVDLTTVVKGLHPNFQKFYAYGRNMNSDQIPDYAMIKNLLNEILTSNDRSYNGQVIFSD
jgi:serine/threonine protein kinase